MKVKNFISILDTTTKWTIVDEYGNIVWYGRGARYNYNNNLEIKTIQWTKKGLKIFV